ncbi:MAG TPA: radical SAM protein [Acidobacteriota bacterium]|nr:radical SAM protein [Acidobacteriota bacterium]
MKEQDMKSVYLPTNRKPERVDPTILAASTLNHFYFKTEKIFQELSLEEKANLVMSFNPEIFQVETTTRCNLNCPLCSTHHLKRGYTEMPLELVQMIVDDNPQIHYICLHLMGEPLLSKSIFSTIEYLKSNKIYTYFSTNGMLLEQKVDEILSSRLDKISISLDGINQEELAQYRVNADLRKILRGIARLKEARDARDLAHPLIQVQTLMFSYNEVKEDRVVGFLKSLGVDRIKLKKPSFDTFGGKNSKGKAFLISDRDTLGKYSRGRNGYFKYRDRSVCRLLFQGFALSDGSVVPCCIDYDGAHTFGNLNTHSWRKIWTSEQRREALTRYFSGELDICRQCSLGYDYSTTVFDQA